MRRSGADLRLEPTNMDRKTITAQLRAQFFPVLVNEGFTRTGDVLRRELEGGVVHVVEIQHRPRSGVFQVGLGAHLAALGDVAGGAPVPVEKMRDHDCAWRSSVLSGFRRASDAEFAYGATAAEASESVAFAVSEWPRQSAAFFGGCRTSQRGSSAVRRRASPPISTPVTCSPGRGSPMSSARPSCAAGSSRPPSRRSPNGRPRCASTCWR